MKFVACLALFLISAIPALTIASPLDPQEKYHLQFMKQEEKLAREVYLAMHEKWQHRVFTNIARAEQRHMNALTRLLETFEVEDLTPTEHGLFTFDELNDLYAKLIAKGNQSPKDALEVGRMIETTDIEDLDEAIANTQNESILATLHNLRNASERHLAAFNRNLNNGGKRGHGNHGGRHQARQSAKPGCCCR